MLDAQGGKGPSANDKVKVTCDKNIFVIEGRWNEEVSLVHLQ